MTRARLPCLPCTRAPAEAVALDDDNTRPVTFAHCSQTILFVVTRDDRGRRATTATTMVSAQRDVTTRSAAVCKMSTFVAVTAITKTTTTAVLVLLLLAFACPSPTFGQLQGKYNGPYPDICPRYDSKHVIYFNIYARFKTINVY